MVWKYVERGSWSYYLMGLAAGELIPLSCLFMLELVLASGQPVVNFASVTMSWVFSQMVFSGFLPNGSHGQ